MTSKAPLEQRRPASFWDDLFSSVFSPEYNTVPQKIMNLSFYGLFLVLAVLVFLTDYNLHVIALFTLAVGLFISVNWYVTRALQIHAQN